MRRLCCDAAIVPVVLNSTGATLDLGREQRLASRAQRRALRAMHRTCAHPGCTVRFADCEIHHVIDWDHHGPTNLANLLPLCNRHHHLVHEGRWTLTLHPDRSITLHRPDGTLHHQGTTIDVTPTGLPNPGADADIIHIARNRARALGPPARAPAQERAGDRRVPASARLNDSPSRPRSQIRSAECRSGSSVRWKSSPAPTASPLVVRSSGWCSGCWRLARADLSPVEMGRSLSNGSGRPADRDGPVAERHRPAGIVTGHGP